MAYHFECDVLDGLTGVWRNGIFWRCCQKGLTTCERLLTRGPTRLRVVCPAKCGAPLDWSDPHPPKFPNPRLPSQTSKPPKKIISSTSSTTNRSPPPNSRNLQPKCLTAVISKFSPASSPRMLRRRLATSSCSTSGTTMSRFATSL